MKKVVSGCFCGRFDDGSEAKLEWDNAWSRVTPNKNGTSGWTIVLESTSSRWNIGAHVKVHLCAHNPCNVRYADSKYGDFVPEHVQQITELTPKPVVEESRSCGSDLPQQVPLRPGSAAPANQDATLSRVEAFHPKCGLDQHVQPPAQIEADILGRIISLAQEIRRPRQYVGYSFFILFGLARRCRPHIWEGESVVDLIETFIPWASEQCKDSCAVAAVCVCYEEGVEAPRMIPVSEDHPLHETKHFLSAIQLSAPVDSNADTLEAYYHKLAVALLGTVCDGDCGVDCCCQMLCLPQTSQQRLDLREVA